MTRLLVSVRSAAEARTALAAGADLIDIKEPSLGSLGAASAATIAEVLHAVAGRVPVSAALGELFLGGSYRPPGDDGLRYVKWGLAGAAEAGDWTAELQRAIQRLPATIAPVAVQYADWQRAASPSPQELLAACRALRLPAVLVDTFDKSAGAVLDAWPLIELEAFVAAARDLRMTIVLGGSLTLQSVPRVLPLAPDYIAVRGAACQAGREGTLEGSRVEALVALLGASRPAQR